MHREYHQDPVRFFPGWPNINSRGLNVLGADSQNLLGTGTMYSSCMLAPSL